MTNVRLPPREGMGSIGASGATGASTGASIARAAAAGAGAAAVSSELSTNEARRTADTSTRHSSQPAMWDSISARLGAGTSPRPNARRDASSRQDVMACNVPSSLRGKVPVAQFAQTPKSSVSTHNPPDWIRGAPGRSSKHEAFRAPAHGMRLAHM